jgi:hypothetical protein
MPMKHRAQVGRPPKYQWEALMDGKEHCMTEDVDFDCMASSFGVLVRRTAKVYGREVSVSVVGDKVYFQFGGRKVA